MVEEVLEKGSEEWEICVGSSHPRPPLLKDLLGKHEDTNERQNLYFFYFFIKRIV